jgi:hypothetical protein
MQLEHLQNLWNQLDDKVDRSLAIENELLRRVVLEPVSRRMHWMTIWPAIDIPLSITGIGFLISFIGQDWGDSRVLVPAFALILALLALLIDSIRQIAHMTGIDWSGPVAQMQTSLEKIHIAKVRQFKWIMLLSPLLFTCALLVAVQWCSLRFTGDRMAILNKLDPNAQNWVLGNLLFGVVFAGIGGLILFVLARFFGKTAWWQSMLDGVSGAGLKRARKDVELWASLRRDPQKPS